MTDFTPGQTITTTHKGIEHVCTVVDTPDGVRFDVDGTQYTSLSKAALAGNGSKLLCAISVICGKTTASTWAKGCCANSCVPKNSNASTQARPR